jgi:hypothetical protein
LLANRLSSGNAGRVALMGNAFFANPFSCDRWPTAQNERPIDAAARLSSSTVWCVFAATRFATFRG